MTMAARRRRWQAPSGNTTDARASRRPEAERSSHDHRKSAHAGEVRAMTAESAKPPASRRTFLAGTGAAAAGTAAAALLDGPLAGTAQAAGAGCPPRPISAVTQKAPRAPGQGHRALVRP